MQDTKKAVKFFLLPDYEQEEVYLTEMHRSGWRFKCVRGFTYTFECCEPAHVVYRLDFAEPQDRSAYVAMFREYGWEYIQDLNGYSYFRKDAAGVSAEETELFSDSESRLDMMKRIISTKLLPVWVIFICLIVPNFMKVMTHGFDESPFHTVFTVFFTAIFVLYTYILIRCLTAFSKLKKKYKKE